MIPAPTRGSPAVLLKANAAAVTPPSECPMAVTLAPAIRPRSSSGTSGPCSTSIAATRSRRWPAKSKPSPSGPGCGDGSSSAGSVAASSPGSGSGSAATIACVANERGAATTWPELARPGEEVGVVVGAGAEAVREHHERERAAVVRVPDCDDDDTVVLIGIGDRELGLVDRVLPRMVDRVRRPAPPSRRCQRRPRPSMSTWSDGGEVVAARASAARASCESRARSPTTATTPRSRRRR